MEVIERRRREREERLRRAKRFAESILGLVRPASVIVIGSTARGDFNAWSDIDVLIVSPSLPKNPLERYDLLRPHLLPGIEPIPLRPEDVERLVEKGAPVIDDVARGVPLLDDLGLLRRLSGRSRPGPPNY